jgi:small-conductance mechanosensitive channel
VDLKTQPPRRIFTHMAAAWPRNAWCRVSLRRSSLQLRLRPNRFLAILVCAAMGAGMLAYSQNPPIATPDPAQIIQFLGRTIEWYRQLSIEQQIATEPGDQIVVNDNREIADQAVRLSFDFARANADAADKPGGRTQAQTQPGTPSQYQGLIQMEARLDKQVQDTQAEVNSMRQKLETATGKQREKLQSQLSETQGEVDLDSARRDVIRSMVEFVSGTSANGLGGTGLRAEIEQLAASVPAASVAPPKSNDTRTSPTPLPQPNPALLTASKPEPSGIWDQTADLLAISRKMRTIDNAIQQTNALEKMSTDIRGPALNSLRDMSNRGDQLATAADTADTALLAQQKQQLDALTAQFKQISAVVIPLSKQMILLQLYQRNLVNWHAIVRSQFMAELKGLFLRIGFLILLLAGVFAAAEVWRRAIFRYIHEPRRRYQFLLLRKFFLWFTIAIIVGLAFASRLGSVVTFAGLLTAGVAVALQNVILSIVGYFFLIGRYGIRVGDRVQSGSVTGTVIDIGLVRFHLMELAGTGSDVPTGRVVAFSNSLVFQPGAGLFKQIPGTNFVWHEITLTLSPDADYEAVKKRWLGIAETVLADYHDEMERQHQAMENTYVTLGKNDFRPTAHLHFTASGPQVTLRFPVDLQHAAEIDERLTRELLQTLDHDPKLKGESGATPSIAINTNVVSREV